MAKAIGVKASWLLEEKAELVMEWNDSCGWSQDSGGRSHQGQVLRRTGCLQLHADTRHADTLQALVPIVQRSPIRVMVTYQVRRRRHCRHLARKAILCVQSR